MPLLLRMRRVTWQQIVPAGPSVTSPIHDAVPFCAQRNRFRSGVSATPLSHCILLLAMQCRKPNRRPRDRAINNICKLLKWNVHLLWFRHKAHCAATNVVSCGCAKRNDQRRHPLLPSLEPHPTLIQAVKHVAVYDQWPGTIGGGEWWVSYESQPGCWRRITSASRWCVSG